MHTGLDALFVIDKFCAAASRSELKGLSAAETAQKCIACLIVLHIVFELTPHHRHMLI